MTATKGEIVEAPTGAVQTVPGNNWFMPNSWAEAERMALTFAKTDSVPSKFRNKPADILAAWALGASLKLDLMSSLRFIAVVNGMPSIWGDAALAICRAHPLFEYIEENADEIDMEGENPTAVCTIMRRGDRKPVTRKFSKVDAQVAGIWEKNVHKTYPRRMLQMRARSWTMRDAFPDALCGMPIYEEQRDITSDVKVVDAEVDTRTESQKLLAHSKERTVDLPSREEAEAASESMAAAADDMPEETDVPGAETPTLVETIRSTIGSAKTAAHLEAIVDRMKDLYEEAKLHSTEQAQLTQECIDRGAELAKGKGKK